MTAADWLFAEIKQAFILKERKKLDKSLKRNFYYVGREWPYKAVKPRIIAEQYLEETQFDSNYTDERVLTDYKFFVLTAFQK